MISFQITPEILKDDAAFARLCQLIDRAKGSQDSLLDTVIPNRPVQTVRGPWELQYREKFGKNLKITATLEEQYETKDREAIARRLIEDFSKEPDIRGEEPEAGIDIFGT